MIKDNPLADHARAFEDASEGGEYSNLAACYLDLIAKYNRLRELAQASLDAWDELNNPVTSRNASVIKAEKADQALRDFLKEG